jgi:hypothetical protein
MNGKIYTAEDCGGDIFLIAGWLGLDRVGFRELVLERLEKEGIPEPDQNIQQLDLCEWDEDAFLTLAQVPNPNAVWKEAHFAALYWTYPGVWADKPVTRMPAELAAEFWDGEGVERSDPHHPDWFSVHADVYDNREKGAS